MATTTEHEEHGSSGTITPRRTSTPIRRQSPEHPADVPHSNITDSSMFGTETFEGYDGAIDDADIDESQAPVQTQIDIAAMRPFTKIAQNAEIVARRQEAILIGSRAMGKAFLVTAQKATRRFYTSTFSKELELLETLLTHVDRVETRSGQFAYRVDKARYTLLLRILHDIAKPTRNSFLLAGKTPPSLPSWGDEEDITNAFLPNDYEIAAYYDFAEDKPQERDLETINAANDFIAARPVHLLPTR
ncbi:hypothetical protein DFH06DRAFT_1291922 [Mycena polygramma]|nr:hypothetical protein DFH06DRAFT_1291922 [Mycena polygramma]